MNKSKIQSHLEKQRTRNTAVAEKVNNNKFLNEFKEFINRGSVVDLAVGIVVGSAFTSIVNSLVNDILMPFIGLISSGIDFSHLSVTIPDALDPNHNVVLAYGNFIQNVINFFIIAFAIFLVVRLLNRARERREKLLKKTKDEEKKQEKEEIFLLREIRDELKKTSKK